MSKWKYTICIKEEWKNAKEKETKESNIILMDKLLSELNSIQEIEKSEELEVIIFNFVIIKNNLETNLYENISEFQEDFNYVFKDLYDWCDISLDGKFGGLKNCLIETF